MRPLQDASLYHGKIVMIAWVQYNLDIMALRRHTIWKIIFVSMAFDAVLLLGYLHYTGRIWYNTLFTYQYQTRGLDVSNHQGIIDWSKVAEEKKYSFVYIKATEGHDFTDDYFAINWAEAKKRGFAVGAYHFFSMRSPGATQAAYFIDHVPKESDALPPVVDVEIALDHNPDQVRSELQQFMDVVERYYEKRPMVYVTYETYNRYINGHFMDYKLWIRDIFKFPTLGDRPWAVWQYSNRGRVKGINTYVDINVVR